MDCSLNTKECQQYLGRLHESVDEFRRQNAADHRAILDRIEIISKQGYDNDKGLAILKTKIATIGALAGLIASAGVAIAQSLIR